MGQMDSAMLKMFVRYLFKLASQHLNQLRVMLSYLSLEEYSGRVSALGDDLARIADSVLAEMK